jgi:hypothetical protein
MDGAVIAAFVAIALLGLALLAYALPAALILWLSGRLLGRRIAVVFGVSIIVYLGDYAIAAHLACFDQKICDSPGMLLLGPTIYVLVPAMMAVTAIILRKIWHDLDPRLLRA